MASTSENHQAALFRRATVGPLEVRNRFVMAPMTRCQSPGGIPGPDVARYYARRAEGGVGLVISEGTSVDHPGASNDGNIPCFHGDAALRGWKGVLEAVEGAGAKMVPQLWHVGLVKKRSVDTLTQGLRPFPQCSPSGVVAAGELQGDPMSVRDIEAVIQAFGNAAADAFRLGFHGIELQGAHGYLIDQFLWEATNHRTDAFGGDRTRRSRFASELVRECRARTSPDFPIVFRLSQWKQQDYAARLARTPSELDEVLMPIVEAGVDIFHCSQRRFWQPEFDDSELTLTGWVRKLTGKATMLVGSVGLDKDMSSAGFAVGARAEVCGLGQLPAMFARGEFDLVAVGRALIANPDWCTLAQRDELHLAAAYSSDLLQALN